MNRYSGQDPQRQSQGYGQPSQPYNQHPQPPPVPAQQQTNVLFNDTSGTPSQPPPSSQFPMGAGNLFSDPMVTSAAMQVGTDFAKEAVEKNLDKVSSFLSLEALKNYFAVDTTYVLKKLFILIFPFSHKDWLCKSNKSQPSVPRSDINAPDLYIPFMAFVTYVLLGGAVLGTQHRFNPEELGILASSLLAWLLVEVLIVWVCLYIFSIVSSLKWMDILAFSGYKYVGMVYVLGASMLGGQNGYYVSITWGSVTIAYFLIQTLRLSLQASSDTGQRRKYLLIAIALFQPFLIVWLTWGLVTYTPPPVKNTVFAASPK